MEKMLGPVLLKGTEEVSTTEALNGKIVCFYFSAHWCPPCRGFTPELCKTYEQLINDKKNVEIVFISSDKEESGFAEYFGTMPWLALPHKERDLKEALSKNYKVKGIPTLVVIGTDLKVITMDGRSEVDNDPTGANFPWDPKPISDVLGTEFIDTEGNTVMLDTFAGKHIAIYFSAHWCPPCQTFTPVLNTLYQKLKETNKWEIIFASSDRDQESFDEYFKNNMSWLAIPYEDRERKNALSQKFGVTGIPCLVMLSPELAVINSNARQRIPGDPEGKEFPWGPKPLVTLDDDPSDINEYVSILFLKGDMSDADAAPMITEMSKLGQAALDKAAANDGEKEHVFFVSYDSDGRVTTQLISAMNLENPKRSGLILLDIDAGGHWYQLNEEAPKVQDIQALIDAHKAGSLEEHTLE